MILRSKRLTAILLSASLAFSMNAFAFAEEVEDTGVEAGIDSVVDAVGEEEEPLTGEEFEADNDFAAIDEIGGIDGVDAVDAENSGKAKDIPNALSGNVTINMGTPSWQVDKDFTVSVDKVKKAITEQLSFTVGSSIYNVKDNKLYLGKTDEANLVSTNSVSDYMLISLNKIRSAGAKVSEGVDLKYADNGTTITDVKGNQLVTFKVTINNSKDTKDKYTAPGAKANTVEGEILLKTPYSGTVSEQRVTFSSGKYALVVTYDAAAEYRGSKVTATSHYSVNSWNKAAKEMGEVDGAIGVGARLEVLSSNNIWYPIDKDNNGNEAAGYGFENYYWKDDNGITLSVPKSYNNTKVGSMYDETGPYFTIKMSYKKKQGEKEFLTQEDKLSLKNALKSTRFHFTIEPKRISSELITYSKFVPDCFYVKKLTYNSGKNTLTGPVQFRSQKKDKKTLNARSMKNVGKKLKIVSKTSHDSNPKAKTDAYFVYDSNQRAVVLTGVNGYYGSAVIDEKVTIK